MADLEQSLEELDAVKQAFKSNIGANGISTSSVEFRNYPNLISQMEKKLPTQTKSIIPTKQKQSVSADSGYKLINVEVGEIPDEYIIPSGNIDITENDIYDVTNVKTVNVSVQATEISGQPIEISSDEEMASALTQANVGRIYKFTGTSSSYETNAIYIVSEV